MPNRIVSDLDPFCEEFRADPYTHYAKLRALGPVVWLEKYGIWAVSHYRICQKVLSDFSVYSNAGGGGLSNYFKEQPWREPSIILEVDPPQHTRARRVLARVLSPNVLQELHASFAAAADDLFAAVKCGEETDAVSTLTQAYPLKVFPDSVGLDPGQRQNLLTYGAMVFGAFGPVVPWYTEFMAKHADVPAWIYEKCRRENLSPSGIGQRVYEAADSGEISQTEALMLVRTLLSAGVDTTADALSLALRLFSQHPEQYAILRDNPGLARQAFEEATRFDSSSQSLFRTTLHSVELAGQQLGKHEKIMVFIGSASRDPSHWLAPDTFDITRSVKGQIGYGVGVHGCVGQMLARLEGECFLAALARQITRIEPAGPAGLRLHPGLRGMITLPLTLTRNSG